MRKIPLILVLILCIVITGCYGPSEPGSTPSPTPPVITTTPSESPTITTPTTPSPVSSELTVTFLDVGQGDSILLQSGSGKTMLIDAGPIAMGTRVSSYISSQGINHLDIAAITHPHEDHIGGMSKVVSDYTIGEFLDIGYPYTTTTYEGLLNLIDTKNIPYHTVSAGDTISWDASVGISVLNPQKQFLQDINENSMVLRLVHGNNVFLFMGDAGIPTENNLSTVNIDADILKVGHHGSKEATSSAFLSRVTPKVSIIEVGPNTYGHPSPVTIQHLTDIGSAIYRTDLDGNIKITSTGTTYTIVTEKQRSTPAPTQVYSTTPLPTAIVPVHTTPVSAVCDCSYNRYNCADFSTHASAQACYNYCISLGKGDIHGLDTDKDGKACESLP